MVNFCPLFLNILSEITFELVDIVRRVCKLKQALKIVFGHADIVKEGLCLCWIHALHAGILDQLAFLDIEVRIDSLDLVD